MCPHNHTRQQICNMLSTTTISVKCKGQRFVPPAKMRHWCLTQAEAFFISARLMEVSIALISHRRDNTTECLYCLKSIHGLETVRLYEVHKCSSVERQGQKSIGYYPPCALSLVLSLFLPHCASSMRALKGGSHDIFEWTLVVRDMWSDLDTICCVWSKWWDNVVGRDCWAPGHFLLL